MSAELLVKTIVIVILLLVWYETRRAEGVGNSTGGSHPEMAYNLAIEDAK